MNEDPFPSPEEIADADRQLIEVVRRRLPQRVYDGERWWTFFRWAALVRMADTLEALLDLMPLRRDVDGQTLLRSLFEQVVTFAWVAIDPDVHRVRWTNSALWDMLKLHNDALRFEGQLGQRLWSDGQVAYVKNRLGIGDDAPLGDAGDCSPASDAKRHRNRPDSELVLPGLADQAYEADRYWSPRVRGLYLGLYSADHVLGFRGLYLPVYRIGSRAAHGSLLALEPYVSRDYEPNRYVIDHAQPASRLGWALAGPLFGMALLIAEQWEQWIDEDEVRRLIDAATGPELEEVLEDLSRGSTDSATEPTDLPES